MSASPATHTAVAPVVSRDMEEALLAASKAGAQEVVQLLLDAGASPGCVDGEGRGPLLYASLQVSPVRMCAWWCVCVRVCVHA